MFSYRPLTRQTAHPCALPLASHPWLAYAKKLLCLMLLFCVLLAKSYQSPAIYNLTNLQIYTFQHLDLLSFLSVAYFFLSIPARMINIVRGRCSFVLVQLPLTIYIPLPYI